MLLSTGEIHSSEEEIYNAAGGAKVFIYLKIMGRILLFVAPYVPTGLKPQIGLVSPILPFPRNRGRGCWQRNGHTLMQFFQYRVGTIENSAFTTPDTHGRFPSSGNSCAQSIWSRMYWVFSSIPCTVYIWLTGMQLHIVLDFDHLFCERHFIVGEFFCSIVECLGE